MDKQDINGDGVTVIVPVYNGARTILETIGCLLDQTMRPREIIIVDDGSTDGTSEVLAEYEARGAITVISKPNEGKGSAVALGIKATRGDFVVIQDADTEYDPVDIPALLTTMTQTGALAVYGSRYAGRYRKTGLFLNTIANTILTFATNLVNNVNLSDVMTGYKLFDGRAIRAITLKSHGFEFEAEVTCKLARRGIAIYEAPISYNARTYYEGKKIRVRDGWRTLSALIRYGLFGND